MRKTLQDLAAYLKEILVPETEEAYAVDPAYTVIATEADIRAGVRTLRAFLSRVFDAAIAEGGKYDQPKKVAHEYENRTTLSGYYPFLHNLNTLLIRIGYYGRLSDDATSLACDGSMFDDRLTAAKSLEALRFLMACGLGVDGIDIDNKKQKLAELNTVLVTYPDDPAMLTGLKVMAVAEVDHRTLLNQDVLLRCDWRAIKRDATDTLSIVEDTIRPLPADVQAFVLRLHHRYVDKGFTTAVETKGYHIYIRYCYRRKDVWGLNASLSNGYHINVKATKTDAYPEVVQALHPYLRGIIAQGYGCGRKRFGKCDGGCRGMPIPLDAAVRDMQDDIITWFDRETACLQKK